jgi:hypothetical protein
VGARFFADVQTGPQAHPASCTMGTGSFSGVKRSGRGADPSSAEVENELAIPLLSLKGLRDLQKGCNRPSLVCSTMYAIRHVAHQLTGLLLLSVRHISNSFIFFKFTFSTWVEMVQSVERLATG